MEWVILFAIICMYSDLNSKIKKINDNQGISKTKDYSILKNMIGKTIKVVTDEEGDFIFGFKTEGILRSFNEIWLTLEVESKKEKSLIYIRLKNIESISEINSKQ